MCEWASQLRELLRHHYTEPAWLTGGKSQRAWMTLLNINNIDLDNERFIRSTKHAVVNIVLEQGNLKVYETRLESLKHSRLNAFSFSQVSWRLEARLVRFGLPFLRNTCSIAPGRARASWQSPLPSWRIGSTFDTQTRSISFLYVARFKTTKRVQLSTKNEELFIHQTRCFLTRFEFTTTPWRRFTLVS